MHSPSAGGPYSVSRVHAARSIGSRLGHARGNHTQSVRLGVFRTSLTRVVPDRGERMQTSRTACYQALSRAHAWSLKDTLHGHATRSCILRHTHTAASVHRRVRQAQGIGAATPRIQGTHTRRELAYTPARCGRSSACRSRLTSQRVAREGVNMEGQWSGVSSC